MRAFDAFQAFRVSLAGQGEMRLVHELARDRSAGSAWDEASRVARGLHSDAAELLQAVMVSTTPRQLAAGTTQINCLSDALSAYRDRADALSRGDGVLGLLETAWNPGDSAGGALGPHTG